MRVVDGVSKLRWLVRCVEMRAQQMGARPNMCATHVSPTGISQDCQVQVQTDPYFILFGRALGTTKGLSTRYCLNVQFRRPEMFPFVAGRQASVTTTTIFLYEKAYPHPDPHQEIVLRNILSSLIVGPGRWSCDIFHEQERIELQEQDRTLFSPSCHL